MPEESSSATPFGIHSFARQTTLRHRLPRSNVVVGKLFPPIHKGVVGRSGVGCIRIQWRRRNGRTIGHRGGRLARPELKFPRVLKFGRYRSVASRLAITEKAMNLDLISIGENPPQDVNVIVEVP